MSLKELSNAVIAFSVKFLNELDTNKNVVSSPLSAEILLALIALGATGPARSELLETLNFPNGSFIESSFTTLSLKLKALAGVTLNVANKIYIKEGPYDLNPKLKNKAVKVFDTDFEKVDFNNAVAAAALINGWVERKTNKRIKDIMNPDCFDKYTRLVLVNAIYFKGQWKDKFNERCTRERPFYTTATDSVEVLMMRSIAYYKYGEDQQLDAKLLQMLYVGDETSMLVILPNQIDGLNGVMKKLADGYGLMNAVEKMTSKLVNVIVPKFKIETTIDVKSVLRKLGINAIFKRDCLYLKEILNTSEKLYVSDAIQKAFIEVNEEGAEAAAATGGVAMRIRCVPMDPPPIQEFVADRAFLYVLMGADRVPLFLGTFRGPHPLIVDL